MKHVQACLSDREDRESSFLRCWVPVSIVQAWLSAGQPYNAVLTSEGVLRSTYSTVYVPEKIEKAIFTAVKAL